MSCRPSTHPHLRPGVPWSSGVGVGDGVSHPHGVCGSRGTDPSPTGPTVPSREQYSMNQGRPSGARRLEGLQELPLPVPNRCRSFGDTGERSKRTTELRTLTRTTGQNDKTPTPLSPGPRHHGKRGRVVGAGRGTSTDTPSTRSAPRCTVSRPYIGACRGTNNRRTEGRTEGSSCRRTTYSGPDGFHTGDTDRHPTTVPRPSSPSVTPTSRLGRGRRGTRWFRTRGPGRVQRRRFSETSESGRHRQGTPRVGDGEGEGDPPGHGGPSTLRTRTSPRPHEGPLRRKPHSTVGTCPPPRQGPGSRHTGSGGWRDWCRTETSVAPQALSVDEEGSTRRDSLHQCTPGPHKDPTSPCRDRECIVDWKGNPSGPDPFAGPNQGRDRGTPGTLSEGDSGPEDGVRAITTCNGRNASGSPTCTTTSCTDTPRPTSDGTTRGWTTTHTPVRPRSVWGPPPVSLQPQTSTCPGCRSERQK